MSLTNAPLTNSPFILSEVSAALEKLVEAGEPTTIYLSQFPMTEEDAAFLAKFLGRGATTIEMEGIAPTRFRETSYAGVWRGRVLYVAQQNRLADH